MDIIRGLEAWLPEIQRGRAHHLKIKAYIRGGGQLMGEF